MSGTIDVNRLRNWARGYERLVEGGLGEHAHTVGIDDFADDEGKYPYITAADVHALLDEVESVRAVIAALDKGEPTWPRGMCGSPDDMFSRRDLRSIISGVTR